MTRERKKGQLTLAGTDPMTFVEMDASTGEPWPPEQEAIADAVSSAVKTYLKSAETLATGKYAHFRAQIPEYLSNPGQVLILMCSNGVVIRYERKSGADRKLAIAALPKNFAEVAALLSQNLI